MQNDLFHPEDREQVYRLSEDAVFLPGFIGAQDSELLTALEFVLLRSPLRYMQTPGGKSMSVALSSCGALGWMSDDKGYRYTHVDSVTGDPWPDMPEVLLQLAKSAAQRAGFKDFIPDACLINCYVAESRMSLHQDNDEWDLTAPIVSISLGLPADFLWAGFTRSSSKQVLLLQHGDVLVWGGKDRLRFHGIKPLKEGWHPLTGDCRINLTFRKTR